MKSINSQNEYVPLRINISLRRDTLRLISEMANDMGISIDEVLSFLAEDSVIDLEICLLYTSPSPRDRSISRMPSSA